MLCLSHDENLAEELTQETFYRAIQNINKFRGECKISVWLCQIAKHLFYKECRKKYKTSINIEEIEENEQIRTEISIEEQIIEMETKQELIRYINKLDKNTKKVMYLRINGELSFREIGILMGRTENWSRNIFYRGKNKIKEMVQYE